MIRKCEQYARAWKITFNPKNSSISKLGNTYHEDWDFELNGEKVPKTNSVIHLGLPIGTSSNINDFMNEKMRKVERAFYSLYTIGCKPARLPSKNYCALLQNKVSKYFTIWHRYNANMQNETARRYHQPVTQINS